MILMILEKNDYFILILDIIYSFLNNNSLILKYILSDLNSVSAYKIS